MRGFTLIELMIVTAIVLSVSVLAGPFYSRFLGQNAVANTTDQIVQSLRKAQFYAMESRKSGTSGWGVNYAANTLTVYQGNTYATRNAALDEKFDVSSVSQVWGLGEVNFARGTGLPTVVSATAPTPTPTGLPGGATSTPTPTLTPTPTTAGPTATPVPPGATAFQLGATGWSDVIAHQLVRTADDRLYYFGYGGDFSSMVYGYWMTTPGLPSSLTSFPGSVQWNYGSVVVSTDVVYDGGNIIHILTNLANGTIADRPFDTLTNLGKPLKTLDTAGATGYTNVGTSGLSAAMDTSGKLHVSYWSTGNHITYRVYTYDSGTDTLTLVEGPTQVDGAESSSNNHPSLAVSPADGSVTVAWVAGTTGAGNIWSRARTVAGAWGAAVKVNAADVWTAPDSGLNIDQGPSLIITGDGVKHLVYIENWRGSAPYDYGRVHYVTNNGSGWVDQYTGWYSHDPALVVTSGGEMYVFGHGWALNTGGCLSYDDMCYSKKNGDGTWGLQQLLAAHTGSFSYDTSPSVKWSVVGWNRPETIEMVFPYLVGGSYANTQIWYGRISFPAQPTPTPTPSLTPTPTGGPTPTPTPTGQPTPTPTPVPPDVIMVITVESSQGTKETILVNSAGMVTR